MTGDLKQRMMAMFLHRAKGAVITYRINVRGKDTCVMGWNMAPAFAAITGFEKLTGMYGAAFSTWPISNAWQRSAEKRNRTARRSASSRPAPRQGKNARKSHAFLVFWEVDGSCGIETVYAHRIEAAPVKEATPLQLAA